MGCPHLPRRRRGAHDQRRATHSPRDRAPHRDARRRDLVRHLPERRAARSPENRQAMARTEREIVSIHSRMPSTLGTSLLPSVLLLFVTGCADDLLLHPWTSPIDPRGATRAELRLAEGRVLECWKSRSSAVAESEAPDAYVLEFTGNGTRAEEIATFVAQRWSGHKVEVWCPNYPGYGG